MPVNHQHVLLVTLLPAFNIITRQELIDFCCTVLLQVDFEEGNTLDLYCMAVWITISRDRMATVGQFQREVSRVVHIFVAHGGNHCCQVKLDNIQKIKIHTKGTEACYVGRSQPYRQLLCRKVRHML